MKAFTLYLALALAALSSATPGDASYCCCLSDSDAKGIAAKYLRLYEGHLDLEDSIFTNDVVAYDYGLGNNNITESITRGKDGLPKQVDSLTKAPEAAVIGPRYEIIDLIHNCSNIAVRWDYVAQTSGSIPGVPRGQHVNFKGTDMLTIDCPKKLIQVAQSSEDLINFYQDTGISPPGFKRTA